MSVVYTGGTFDLFHFGHVNLLAKCRALGDRVVVALNTDEFVARYKGQLPVWNYAQRESMLRACRYVDESVVYSTEQDLIDLILTLPIDVRILGVEYEDTNFTGRNEGAGRGIQHVFNKRDHSFSSSSLRKRVAESERNKV